MVTGGNALTSIRKQCLAKGKMTRNYQVVEYAGTTSIIVLADGCVLLKYCGHPAAKLTGSHDLLPARDAICIDVMCFGCFSDRHPAV
jgi:hypothetical protein